MKQAINFRLSKHSITVLSVLAQRLELTKTEIVEKALQAYFEKEYVEQHSPLMAFAGILSNDDADDMLQAIYSSRTDTERDLDL